MKRMNQSWLSGVALIMVLVIGVASGWGMNSQAISDQIPINVTNTRIDLDNPFFQGNFGYRYPVEVPSGINGLEPTLAIVYNSELAGETFLGVGWELVGYNQITRNCRQNVPWYDNRDSFILTLNGKAYPFDAAGQVEGGALQVTGSAGEGWRVYEPDGTELLFTPGAGTPNGVFSWLLTRMTDTNGNTVVYTYDKSVLDSEGVAYLDSITYQDNLQVSRKIKLTYEGCDRAENGAVSLDPTLTYWPGFKVRYTKRLQSIATGDVTYTFEYKTSKTSRHGLLAAIQPSEGERVGFGYQSELSPETKWEFTEKWGLSFLANYVKGTSTDLFSFDLLVRDMDNDGLDDLIIQKHREYYLGGYADLSLDFLPQIYRNDGAGNWQQVDDLGTSRSNFSSHYYDPEQSPLDAGGPFSDFDIRQSFAPLTYDLNGDGCLDLLLVGEYFYGALDTYQNRNPLNRYGSDLTTYRIRWMDKEYVSFLNDGTGKLAFHAKTTEDTNGDAKFPAYLDLNDDGQPDTTPSWASTQPIVTDINGDRYPDFYSSSRYYLNQGAANFNDASSFASQEKYFRNRRLMVDLNGDGIAETFTYNKSTRQLTCSDPRYNVVLPSGSPYWSPLIYNIGGNYIRELFNDVNNDGFKDLMTLSGTYLNTTKPDLLSQVTEAETIAVSYTRQAVASQYSHRPEQKGPQLYRWAVASITSDHETTNFTYRGGLHDLYHREFRGYQQITVQGPESTSVYTYQPEERSLFGLVRSVTGPDGQVGYDYTFAASRLTHLKTTSQPVNGPQTVVENDYDDTGNLTRQAQDLTVGSISGSIIRNYEYAKNGYVINALKRSAETGSGTIPTENIYYYDNTDAGQVSKGNLTRIDSLVKPADTGSADVTVNIAYDHTGIATSVADAAGNVTTTQLLSVDAKTKKRLTRNALGHESYELIDLATGLVTESVDANQAKTLYSYYPDRRLKRVTRPDGGFTEYEYRKNSDSSSVTITRVKEDTATNYLLWHEELTDPDGNLVQTIDKRVLPTEGSGSAGYQTTGPVVLTRKTYNSRGQVVTESLPYFETETTIRWVRYKYEETGTKHRLLQVTQPDGSAVRYEYDDVLQKTAVIDAKGNRTETAESYEYANIGERTNLPCRVVTTTAPSGRTVAYYDLNGNLLQQVDPNGKAKVYWYDSLGRVYRSTDPYKGEVGFTYDPQGRLAQKRDAKGQLIQYEYDPLSRIKAKTFADGRKIEWLYDLTTADNAAYSYGIGRLCAYRDPSGLTRLGYDVAGNLIRKQRDGYSLNFGYDLTGRLQSIRYPNSYQVNYAYDMLGLTTVTQGAKVLAAYQDRNALGQARAVTYANGIQTNLDLNPDNGQMKKLTVTGGQTTASGGVLLNLSYTHDQLGNVTAVTDGTPLVSGHLSPLNEVYSYDNANRLISAVGINGNLSYQYDAVGNITGKEGVAYSYDDPNHPYAPTSGTSGFKATYDANGNMITKTDAYGNQLVLDYDEENQLTKAIKNGIYTEDYIYDATGYRVKRSANGVLTDYVYWGNTLLYETTAGKAIDYVWAEGKLIAKVESSGTTYFHHDHLGSSKLQTDDAGKVISTDVSKPFGPRSCDEVIKDDFATLAQVNTTKSKITFDEVNGKILAPVKGVAQDNLLANHSPVTTTSLEYFQVKALRFRLTAADKDRTAKVVFAYQGKARVRIIGEDNVEYLTKEYTTRTERTQSFSYSMSAAPNQLYLVTLELAANPTGGVLEARNTEYEATWGSMASLGELWTLPVTLQEDARSVRLSWSGVGVSFMVSTDNAKTWESVENGKATLLRNPGRNLVLKAMLQMAATTVLDGYELEVNPANYSLFTGKVLTEETGLVYGGMTRRWGGLLRWTRRRTGRIGMLIVTGIR